MYFFIFFIDGEKTSEEVALEGRILREMLEIVERRDSLQGQLEAERLRWRNELDSDITHGPSLAYLAVMIGLLYFLIHYFLCNILDIYPQCCTINPLP